MLLKEQENTHRDNLSFVFLALNASNLCYMAQETVTLLLLLIAALTVGHLLKIFVNK